MVAGVEGWEGRSMSAERITDPAQIRALQDAQREDERRWSVAFDAQYELCTDVHRLIDERTKDLPWEYRVAVYLYVVEHLGEHARFTITLGPDSDVPADDPEPSEAELARYAQGREPGYDPVEHQANLDAGRPGR